MASLAPLDRDRSIDPAATADNAKQKLGEVARIVKPKLRGWLHAGMAPLATAGGIVLVALAPDRGSRIAAAIYLAASLLLFGTSAIYHRFTWGPRGEAILRRMDHANIYLFIAATYTPIAVLMLSPRASALLLTIIWSAAAAGLVFRLCWLGAPRWLYTALYLAMGWAALFWLPQIGAVVYARKSPDPSPTWFGYHEIFHACTILAFAAQYIAISIAMYT